VSEDIGRPLRVLLFSPLPGRDPVSGDTAYTESLLAAPPPDVEFITYSDAVESGVMRVRGRRPHKGRRWTAADALILVVRGLEMLGRRTGMMYREPTWFVSLDTAEIDLIHQHLFAIRQIGPRVPVVSSFGYPLNVHYKFRERWSPSRLRIATALEVLWSVVLRVHTPWLHGVQPAIMTGYSRAAVDWLVARGWPTSQTRVISTGMVPLGAASPEAERDPLELAFVGRDFYRKGGDIAVAAFELLRSRHQGIHLTIVTSSVPSGQDLPDGVHLVLDAERAYVQDVVLARASILLAPTRADCGVPYGLLEAMQRGCAIVTSDTKWLDDRLAPPAVHRVAPEATTVAAAAESLLSHAALAEAGTAVRELWERCFSSDALGVSLRAAYEDCLTSGAR
jgi:glycosyltransferase involved in cell wall biosynthesis